MFLLGVPLAVLGLAAGLWVAGRSENAARKGACETRTVTVEDSVRPNSMTYYRRECGAPAP